jgi:signal transduction histidine kinase/response regulator of citrate/malate metabolism/streptogramin lyase
MSFENYDIGESDNTEGWINAIHENYDGSIWVGTRKSLVKFDPITNEYERFYEFKTPTGNISLEGIEVIRLDSVNNIWLGVRNGLVYLDVSNGTAKVYRYDKGDDNSLLHDRVNHLVVDDKDNVWVGTVRGLSYLNIKTGVFSNYQHKINDSTSLSHNRVLSLALDQVGNLWVGTANGLNLMNMTTGEFTVFGEIDGLPDSTIYSVEIDNNGFVWVGTNRGLSRLNPSTRVFKNYTVGDGLQGREFIAASSFKSKDGELFFGGINGFNRFYPDELVTNRDAPEVVITDMLVLNKPVSVIQESDKDDKFFLEMAVHEAQEITLTSEESLVTFEFSAMQFSNPSKNKYAYKLEGFDKDWIYTDYKNRRATYTGLPDGEFVLRVKASNSDGYWSDEGTALNITVLPSFWNSWKAYLIYLILSVFVILIVIRLKKNKMNFEQDLVKCLEEKVARQTASIKEESQKAINAMEIKSQFLANMSHEIRTPLTSIIGRAESILYGDSANSAQEIKIIHTSGLHLLGLLDNTLDLSKMEADRFELEVKPMNLIDIIADVRGLFLGQANSKGIDFVIHHTLPSPFMINIDGFRLKQVLINLCSNAIKFTDNGTVRLDVLEHCYNDTKCLTFAVSDTGIGMTSDQLVRVFDAFSQADNTISRRFGGSGLGLSLSEKLADFMGGDIGVESTLGEGSTFTLSLPYTPTSAVAIVENFTRSKKTFKGKILLGEDHDDNRELISRLLTGIGFEVYTAKNGYEVIESYLKNKPDLILLDIQMPVMDGVEAIKILRAKRCSIPIVALTANTLAKDIEEYLTIGFTGYQSKPFERVSFINAVAQYFEPQGESLEQNSSMSNGDDDISDLIASFESSLKGVHQEFLKLYENNDYELLSTQAHKLAGSAQMFGYAKLTNLSVSLELSINDNDDLKVKRDSESLLVELSSVVEKLGL